MIRVMIVEDEPPISTSLKRIIEMKSEFYEVVNISINGKRALKYLESNEVDLIFTDIKMPVMSGLELVENIRRFSKNANCSIIVLSGFQNFEYAQIALKNSVIDYVLKPINKVEILEILDKYYDKFIENNKIGQKILLEKTIKNEKVSLEFNMGEQYGVLLCCFGTFPISLDAIDPNFNLHFSNIQIEERVLSSNKTNSCMCLNGKSISEKLILFTAKDLQQVSIISKDIFEYLQKITSLNITLVMYKSLVNMNNIKSIFSLLRKELYSVSGLFSSKFAVYGFSDDTYIKFDESINLKIIKALTSKNKENIYNSIFEFIEATIEMDLKLKNFILLLEKNIMKYYDKFLDISQLAEFYEQVELSVSSSTNKETLAKEITEVFYYWLNPNMQSSSSNELMDDIGYYIKNNHKNNISLSMLAKEFGISSANLSKKFKSYYKMSIPEYVNKYRIDLALEMMNFNDNIMMKELSIEVGYNDQYYFSKTFKKIVGIWPTEYINNKENLK